MGELAELKRVQEFVDQCMKCGFCTFFCPVYQEEKVETSVARGKNYLVKLVLKGEQGFTPELSKIIGKCLLCKRCVVNCPAKARIDRVVVAARAQLVEEKGLGLLKALLFRRIMADRKKFGRLLRIARSLQGLLPRTEGKIRHLPDFLKALGRGRNIPELSRVFLRERVKEVYSPEANTPKLKVGFFTGCAMEFVYPELGLKVIETLRKTGVEIHVPRSQNCCGAAIYASGDLETARILAYKNIEAMKDVDMVISGCATCSSTLKHYKEYLARDEKEGEEFERFSRKVKDLTEFLVDRVELDGLRLRGEFQGKVATWHDPCHLVRYQDIKDQPRRILRSLKGLNYVEMEGADLCCGMGGSFSVYHYELSKRIAERKMDSIKQANADIVVTACPGCMIQLLDNILRCGMPQRVHHIVELIDTD